MSRHFHRYLVCSSTDTAGLHFHYRGHILEGLFKNFQRVAFGALLDKVHRIVNLACSNAFLAVAHHTVYERLNVYAVEAHVRYDIVLFWLVTSRHPITPFDYFALGRLDPYLERPWRRSFTPPVSRVPRT